MKYIFFLIFLTLSACDHFKDGTVERMEFIGIQDSLKFIEDEVKEAENDVIVPSSDPKKKKSH